MIKEECTCFRDHTDILFGGARWRASCATSHFGGAGKGDQAGPQPEGPPLGCTLCIPLAAYIKVWKRGDAGPCTGIYAYI